MRAYVGHRAFEQMQNQLSARDLGIVSSLGQHRYLCASQIAALHFGGHETAEAGARVCRRVLARLTRMGVVSRLTRRIGGAHSCGFQHVLWYFQTQHCAHRLSPCVQIFLAENLLFFKL